MRGGVLGIIENNVDYRTAHRSGLSHRLLRPGRVIKEELELTVDTRESKKKKRAALKRYYGFPTSRNSRVRSNCGSNHKALDEYPGDVLEWRRAEEEGGRGGGEVEWVGRNFCPPQNNVRDTADPRSPENVIFPECFAPAQPSACS